MKFLYRGQTSVPSYIVTLLYNVFQFHVIKKEMFLPGHRQWNPMLLANMVRGSMSWLTEEPHISHHTGVAFCLQVYKASFNNIYQYINDGCTYLKGSIKEHSQMPLYTKSTASGKGMK